MTKNNKTQIIRTLLFTPGHNEKLINKALNSGADCVVLDLEDAVPESKKQCARETIKKVLNNSKPANQSVFVRINPLESGLTLLDLDEVSCRELDGIVFPKVYCADDIKAFDAQLTLKERTLGLDQNHFSIIILIETPQSVLNCCEIASVSNRVVGLLFGCEDFLADMEGSHGPDGRSLLVPRHLVAMAARSAGVVPIDTPYVQVKNDDGFATHVQQGVELGFEGILVMTLHQNEMAKKMYTPAPEEIEKAEKMVSDAEKINQDSRGIAVTDGVFVSPPTLKRMKKVLQRSRAITEFENRKLSEVTEINRLNLVKTTEEN